MPTPHGQPRYRAIAEELRKRIQDGAIPPGTLLPPESALIREFAVSRGTIREAIATLRTDGLVTTEQGRGTYTRPQHPIRRLGPDRYNLQHEGGPPTRLVGRDDKVRRERVDAEYREMPAAVYLADLFSVPAGTMLLQRRLLHRTNGVPQQLTTSYYLLEMVVGTPLADRARDPWPDDHVAQLKSLGITVTRIRETVRARMPTTDEMAALELLTRVPLIAIERQTQEYERTVEVASEILYPADRTQVEYEIVS